MDRPGQLDFLDTLNPLATLNRLDPVGPLTLPMTDRPLPMKESR
jgi:hypothetical protein